MSDGINADWDAKELAPRPRFIKYKETPMPKPKSDRHAKIVKALTSAGRGHVAKHVAGKACGKKK